MYDADEAGQNAIVRSAEPLWEAGMALRVAVIPTGHDPDSLIKAEGGARLRELIAGGESFFAYLLQRLSHQHDPATERGKLQIVRQMAEWLARIPSPVLLATYAQQTAQRLDVPESAIRQELQKLQRNRPGSPVPPPSPEVAEAEESIATAPNLTEETLLLQLMLADLRLVDLALERLDPSWLSTSVAGSVIGRILKLHAAGKWDGPHSLMNALADAQEDRLVSELAVTPMPGTALEAMAGDCLATLERVCVKRHLHQIRRQLGQPNLPANERTELQRELLDLELKLRHSL